jgi:transcription antitermination factor NusG
MEAATAGGEQSGGSWIVLKAARGRELQASMALQGRGLAVYAPLRPVSARNSRSVALFPGYVFAFIRPDTDDLLRARSAPGVAYVLPRGGQPEFLPIELIEAIRGRLCVPVADTQALRHGDHVTVVSGPLRWLDAVFDCQLSAAGRVQVLLQMARGTLRVVIDEACLQHTT